MSNRLTYVLVTILICLTSVTDVMAEGFWRSLKNLVDSADYKGCDTTYVRLPKQGFVAYITASPSGAVTNFTAKEPDEIVHMTMKSEVTTLWALRLAYRGWGLSYSSDFQHKADREFSFSTYGRSYGAELRIHKSHDLKGEYDINSIANEEKGTYTGDSDLRTFLVNFYWVFNSRKFSLPAAMSHTIIQRRSAGSWLACINYVDTKLSLVPNEVLDPNYKVGCSFKQINIGGGYAYNFAFGNEHCLLHASVMPLLSVWHKNDAWTSVGDRTGISQQWFTLGGMAHLSFVYNYKRLVLGLSCIYNMSHVYDKDDGLTIYVHNYSATSFVGVRF